MYDTPLSAAERAKKNRAEITQLLKEAIAKHEEKVPSLLSICAYHIRVQTADWTKERKMAMAGSLPMELRWTILRTRTLRFGKWEVLN